MSLLSRLAVQAARAYGILSSKAGVSASYLVVAGGGGGGGRLDTTRGAGGGGAGGYKASTVSLSTLNTYSITVGAGGNGGIASDTVNGSNGSNSTISGTGLSTITSTGGGGGGCARTAGSAGGSGGGSGSDASSPTGGTGISGQGNNGGNGYSAGTYYNGGGGGGAGAVGSNGTSTTAGAGGVGSASSISGSSTYYAGGGGGGAVTGSGAGGSGGNGGGGTGGASDNNGGAATTNTGGGGGGASGAFTTSKTGGNGGSGIVIISYTSATPKFVGGTLTTSGGNQIHTFTSSGTLSPITPITASYLVVAGGGGAGRTVSGGGGGGGYLTSSTTLYSGATYVVTVGGGGAVGATLGARGTNGGNSVISGTGLTTITSLGGGGGGADGTGTVAERSGNSGGSGGGAVNVNGVPGAGTSGQGNAGGNGSTNCAGGGGGAGAVGGNGSGNIGGTGGNGLQSSISGTATYYAGGGGGGGYNTASTNAGGLGGGGNGTNDATNSTAGTTNSGGGGGGAGFTGAPAGTSASGGSGIVIISYAGSQAFNGGLVTSSGGNTIHTFTSTGALTPLTNNLTNSLRFRASASAKLTRTPSTSTNRRTWTWSAWIKRGQIDVLRIFGAATSGSNEASVYFDSNNKLGIVFYIGSENARLITTQVFRDPSAWYHIVVAVDTTQATSANRIKLYVNGNQVTAFDTATYPSQNYETLVNSNISHYYGTFDTSYYFDGYIADTILIDGQALEPYYFGNNDANGVWKPILYKGTYGTNGFYLTFGNTTSTTTLGYDSSPNGNNWTTNNISLTAGTTYDAMTDVPTNTSATVANYPTLNPLSNTSTLTEANLSASNILLAGTTMATPSTGKWYFEYTQTTSIPSGSLWVGVASNTSAIADNQLQGYAYASDGRKVAYNSYTSGYGATWTNGDVIGCALDLDNQTITFYKNNTSQGTAFTSITAQPYVFSLSAGGAASTKGGSINCGQRPFAYTPPTGFVALNTFNLPTPTILQGNKYMDATLYTGTGTSQVVVNQGQFKPDFVWTKVRGTTSNHALVDSVRGADKYLVSNSTAAEDTAATYVTSFNSNGFSLGSGNYASGNTLVGWQWQSGQGSTSSNTSGSITSTVSANTTAGFSIVSWTATGSVATVGHGLGVAPKIVINRQRSTTGNWAFITDLLTVGTPQYMYLDSTAAIANTGWGSSPTSSVISAYSYGSGQTIISYCWAEIAGFSKFGSYVGNGSADGVFVYTGFRPKYIMIKNSGGGATSSLQGWIMLDTSRSPYNQTADALFANGNNASTSNSIYAIDILSNGIKTRGTDGAVNESSATYIYMAFAENPFKNSNAR